MPGISRLLTGLEALENSLREEKARIESHSEYVLYHERMMNQEKALLQEAKSRKQAIEYSVEQLKNLEGLEDEHEA